MVLRQSLAPLKLSRWQFTKLVVKTMLFGSLSQTLVFVAIASLILWVTFQTLFSPKGPRMPRGLPTVRRNDSHYEDVVKEGRVKVRSGLISDLKNMRKLIETCSILMNHTSRSTSATALSYTLLCASTS